MGLTGIIYAAIVVAWAAFLVPLALYRHDQAARTRSIERFSSAMRVLARSGPGATSAGRVVVVPPRREPSGSVVVGESAGPVGASVAAPIASPAVRAAARQAARRRRRVLYVLLAVLVVVGVAAGFAVIPWWSLIVPVALIAGFLYLARRSVRMGLLSAAPASATAPAGASTVAHRAAVRVEATTGAGDDEPTIVLTAAQLATVSAELADDNAVAVSVSAASESLWDPLPVTLPTYVDKPVAKRTARTISLGEPGTWSAGHSAADSSSVNGATAARAAQEGAEESARAVNG